MSLLQYAGLASIFALLIALSVRGQLITMKNRRTRNLRRALQLQRQLARIEESTWVREARAAPITEATHVRVYLEEGNASHVAYYLKEEIEDPARWRENLFVYPLPWIDRGAPGWSQS